MMSTTQPVWSVEQRDAVGTMKTRRADGMLSAQSHDIIFGSSHHFDFDGEP